MSFFDTAKKLANSTIDLINAAAVSADESARRKMRKMSDQEVLSLRDKQPNNKYVKEEAQRRGL
ncbi:MAG: hypothetical protein OIF32_06930 [Campylobacterales bacterium]|nr:hypothetical protein [Campylobacterales bacterium]